MQPAAIATLVATVLTIVALVIVLTAVGLMLKHVNFTLGTVIAGLRSITYAAAPLESVIGDMDRDLTATRHALEDLVEAKTGVRPGAVP